MALKKHSPRVTLARGAPPALRREYPGRFDLIGGHVCLDFINTLDDRHTENPKELLKTYRDLVRFGEATAILSPQQGDTLVAKGYRLREEADAVLVMARELRETLHNVFWAVVQKRAAPLNELARLNASVCAASGHVRLEEVDLARFESRFDPVLSFESILWLIARAAADLLTSDQVRFVGACSASSCRWLFLDLSKNHQRRWCDMKRCGNRAKARRFQSRQQTPARKPCSP
jgi:predicted RNA-binding Zn ribbon-like protein